MGEMAEEKDAPRWRACYTCRDYAQHRRAALAGPLGEKAVREGRHPFDVVDEFMLAAHERHMAGEPLREGGPTRVTHPSFGRLAAPLSPGLFDSAIPPGHPTQPAAQPDGSAG